MSVFKKKIVPRYRVITQMGEHMYLFSIYLCLELPQNQPQITGGGDININYKPGDVLSLNCTSAPSNPPAKLKWLLNDQPVSTNFVILYLLSHFLE